jgi:hypothetical protein
MLLSNHHFVFACNMLSSLLAGAGILGTCVPAAANPNSDVNINETGPGFIKPSTGTTVIPLPASMQLDPFTGMTTLQYELNPWIVPVLGDVVVTEPTPLGTVPQISDVLSFEVVDTNEYVLYVYSDNSDGDVPPAPADVGIPAKFQSNLITVQETGINGFPYSENLNGIVYTPTAGQPGFNISTLATSVGPVTYTFTSDTPEPATIGLLALGGLSLLARRRRTSI